MITKVQNIIFSHQNDQDMKEPLIQYLRPIYAIIGDAKINMDRVFPLESTTTFHHYTSSVGFAVDTNINNKFDHAVNNTINNTINNTANNASSQSADVALNAVWDEPVGKKFPWLPLCYVHLNHDMPQKVKLKVRNTGKFAYQPLRVWPFSRTILQDIFASAPLSGAPLSDDLARDIKENIESSEHFEVILDLQENPVTWVTHPSGMQFLLFARSVSAQSVSVPSASLQPCIQWQQDMQASPKTSSQQSNNAWDAIHVWDAMLKAMYQVRLDHLLDSHTTESEGSEGSELMIQFPPNTNTQSPAFAQWKNTYQVDMRIAISLCRTAFHRVETVRSDWEVLSEYFAYLQTKSTEDDVQEHTQEHENLINLWLQCCQERNNLVSFTLATGMLLDQWPHAEELRSLRRQVLNALSALDDAIESALERYGQGNNASSIQRIVQSTEQHLDLALFAQSDNTLGDLWWLPNTNTKE